MAKPAYRRGKRDKTTLWNVLTRGLWLLGMGVRWVIQR